MVMMLRSWQIAITPELLITGDLIRVEQRARFEMRRQVHCTQAAEIASATAGSSHHSPKSVLAARPTSTAAARIAHNMFCVPSP